MTTNTRTAFSFLAAGAMAAALAMTTSAAAPRFYHDDPVWHDRDTEDASSLKPLDVDLVVDLATNLLNRKAGESVRAQNLNTVDEVPDSSWYTNRAASRSLTPEEVFRGPDTTDGPAPGTWTITASKSDGVTPGFTIRDPQGQLWFLKFDPPGFRAMATGTEVTVTKLLWALGYNVPENHIAYMRRDQLVVGTGATFTPMAGKKRAMRRDDVDALLARVNREPDGGYRIVASKALPGKPIGRIRFFDTRPDDPNDIVPHQHRRELRGYGVFAAWLNHVDAKAINSLDTLVTENGRSFVRHHLLDFGSALGSGALAPAEYWEGSEYLFEPAAVGKAIASFGFAYPTWHTTRFYEAPSIGRMPETNVTFDPEAWRPRVPNQAFLHARADDKFWAASKLMALTTDDVRAAVRAGDFRDAQSEAFLVRALAERRDAIGRAYLTAINPIVEPTLDQAGVLSFRNAAVDADFAKAPGGYRAEWFRFDNATQESARLGESAGRTTKIAAPAPLPADEGAYLHLKVSSVATANASWTKPIDVFFRLQQGQWRLVGLERTAS